MNTCDTCKWWNRNFDPEDENGINAGFCHKISRKGESPVENGAVAYDNFWTGPKFGCAAHEPK